MLDQTYYDPRAVYQEDLVIYNLINPSQDPHHHDINKMENTHFKQPKSFNNNKFNFIRKVKDVCKTKHNRSKFQPVDMFISTKNDPTPADHRQSIIEQNRPTTNIVENSHTTDYSLPDTSRSTDINENPNHLNPSLPETKSTNTNETLENIAIETKDDFQHLHFKPMKLRIKDGNKIVHKHHVICEVSESQVEQWLQMKKEHVEQLEREWPSDEELDRKRIGSHGRRFYNDLLNKYVRENRSEERQPTLAKGNSRYFKKGGLKDLSKQIIPRRIQVQYDQDLLSDL
ncbi:uncharacterized protein [Clytia hemisphaerica]|uniref:Uncharacterized protein n=1 Tax=Clytia hemisphaerica TaxID=252671 RepID=A0A7M5UT75_9CNID